MTRPAARVALGAAILAMAAGALAAPGAQAAPPECQDTYIGSGDWSETANWSNASPPAADEVACIQSGQTVTLAGGAQVVESIQGGTLAVAGGTLTLASAVEESPLEGLSIAGGSVDLTGILRAPVTLSGGTLTGTGAIRGTLENLDGTVAPGDPLGTLTVEGGEFIQGAAGTLRILAEGTQAGQYSQLSVAGEVALGGTLTLVPAGGYATAALAGEQLSVITLGGLATGGFAITEASPALGRGLGVTAQEAVGSIEAVIVAPGAPEADLPPTIAGGIFVGESLSASSGSWFNFIEARRLQWQRCSAAGTQCAYIAGASGQSYTTRGVDAGHTIRVVEFASNQSGEAGPSASGVSGVIQSVPLPQNTSPPRISGHAEAGATLNCSPGAWDHASTGYAYKWTRDGAAIPGAVGPAYRVTTEDEGHGLACVVRAINPSGAGSPARSATLAIPFGGPLPLRCSNTSIELTGMLIRGHSVSLSGIALSRYAGRKVTITLSGIPRKLAAGHAGSTKVAADGTFQLKLTVPRGTPAAKTVYTAKVGGHSSLPLKLNRELLIAGEHPVADGVQVLLRGTGPLAKGSHTITLLRQLSCSSSEVLMRKTMRKGSLTVLLPPAASPSAGESYDRAQTPVGHRLSYSLPIALK